MNKGLTVMGLTVALISGSYTLSVAGEHQMPDGTMMNDSAMGIGKVPIEPTAEIEAAVKLVEVGNKICPVSGEKVGGPMGDGLPVEHNGKMYKLRARVPVICRYTGITQGGLQCWNG